VACRFDVQRRRPEAIDALQKRHGLFSAGAAIDRGLQQRSRRRLIAALKCGNTGVEQFLTLALPLGNGASGALDVRAGAGVSTIEKQDTRPDIHREIVLAGKVMVEAGEKKLFDSGITIAIRSLRGGRWSAESNRVGHPQSNFIRRVAGIITGNFMVQLHMPIIECIPNVSEGRRPDVIEGFVERIRRTGVRVLDYSSDASHNRSVLTLAGEAATLKAAVLALFAAALEAIDLRSHRGEHPRLGAVDVVPFVPIEGVTMNECVTLARDVGAAVAEQFRVPVYLYEEAAENPLRKNLEDIRRGEFEGLAAKMGQPGWAPDFGPSSPHPSAGASVIGARMPLIAYNINLNTDRVEIARKIAAAIRHSSGGFRYVKAMGVKVEDRNLAQVSMNLTNYDKTPIHRVFETVKREAARYGVTILESEIVGLVPSAALVSTAEYYLQLERFTNGQILEHKLRTVD
jgi:glutamate formiminotransferase / 5-formyltetrahydrofolate cyclo-ligase